MPANKIPLTLNVLEASCERINWSVEEFVCEFSKWFSKTGEICNPLSSFMYQAGVPMRYMRTCEPFGQDLRQGLWLYHVLEPERWALMCERVSGANTASGSSDFYVRRQIYKPQNLTWCEYALALLDSIPETTAEHYRNSQVWMRMKYYDSSK